MHGQLRAFIEKHFCLAIILLTIAGSVGYTPLSAREECGCNLNQLQSRIGGKWKGDRRLSERLNVQGLASHKKKNYCEAIGIWCKAAEKDPSFWKPFFNIGCAHSLMGQADLSIEFIKRSIRADNIATLNSFVYDSDLKPIRSSPEYIKLLNKYGGREGVEALLALNRSLEKRDYELFRSLIHKQEGLLVAEEKFSYETLDESQFLRIRKEMYEHGPLTIEERGTRGSLSAMVTTNYHQDPPESPMRCESWQDNYFRLKKIGGKWYLYNIHREGNGGC